MTKNKHDTKSNLAKLLATENISVQHKKVDTAYFDVKNRILCLPIWKEEMPDDVYDLLVGHEVGHALFTPKEDWMFKQKEVPVSFLNVLEDVRIEKMMKQRYPGLRKLMYSGYQKLHQKNFFNTKDKSIANMRFIDRINLHYKVGAFAQVPFHNDIEETFIQRAFMTETFQDVYDLAKEIYEYEKSQPIPKDEGTESSVSKKKEDHELFDKDTKTMSHPDNTKDDEEENKDNEDGADGEESELSDKETEILRGEGDISAKETKVTDGLVSDGKGSIGDESRTDKIEASTDRALSHQLKSFNNEDARDNIYVTLPKPILEKIVVDYKELHSIIDQQEIGGNSLTMINDAALKQFTQFKNSSMKTVNYLVKEFEMKKSADAYKRASISKTGVINVNKLHSYKFNDDIFKKMTVIPDGKNHGMMMFMDWSGSMHSSFYETITQLFNLVFFCKQIKLPYKVYAFSDRIAGRSYDEKKDDYWNYKAGNKVMDKFNLLELFSSEMKPAEFKKACLEVYKVALAYTHNGFDTLGTYYHPVSCLQLGGTPLNAAILTAIPLVKQFITKNKIQKMNTIFLTDGDSHDSYDYMTETDPDDVKDAVYTRRHGNLKETYSYDGTLVVADNKTKHNFNLSYSEKSTGYFELLRKHTGSVILGFHILHGRRSHQNLSYSVFGYDPKVTWQQREKIRKDFAKNKFVSSTRLGYDEQWLIKGGKDLRVEDGEFKVDENKKQSLVAAFKKYSKGKLMSRVILNQFIDRVA